MTLGFQALDVRSRTKALLRIAVGAIAVPVAFAITVETAEAGCKSGYVWREAFAGDVVCVTPHERTKAQRQNAASSQHTAN